jgi:hypothetical protein
VHAPAQASLEQVTRKADAKDALSALLFAMNPTDAVGSGSIVRASARRPAVVRKRSANFMLMPIPDSVQDMLDKREKEEKIPIPSEILEVLAEAEADEKDLPAEADFDEAEADEAEADEEEFPEGFEMYKGPVFEDVDGEMNEFANMSAGGLVFAPEVGFFQVEEGAKIKEMVDEYYDKELGLEELDGEAEEWYEEASKRSKDIINKYENAAIELVDSWIPEFPSEEQLGAPLSLGSMGIEELEKQIDETVAKYQLSKYDTAMKEGTSLISNMKPDSWYADRFESGLKGLEDALVAYCKDREEGKPLAEDALDVALANSMSATEEGRDYNTVAGGLAKLAPQIEAMEKDTAATFENFDTIYKEALK